MREEVSGDFKHPGKKFNRTKKSKRTIYNANNARNRDAFSVTKVNGMLKGESSINNDMNRSTNLGETEDVLIEFIDAKKRTSD